MAKLSRAKGKRGELECVHYWKDIFPDAHRHLEFQEKEADEGFDVWLDHWNVAQVKVGQQVPKKVYQYIEQMKPKEGRFGFVQMKRDRKPWLIVMYADDFKNWLAILKEKGVI